MGGDEFTLLLENCNKTNSVTIANKIISSINSYNMQSTRLDLGISIGIKTVTSSQVAASDLIHQADTACYEAKRLGKNQVQIYNSYE
jgi:diguanylate cyclase (GGDEF)-like protein